MCFVAYILTISGFMLSAVFFDKGKPGIGAVTAIVSIALYLVYYFLLEKEMFSKQNG